MIGRSPSLLWRALGREMLRTGALTATVLVAIISFGAAVKFLAEGKIDAPGALVVMALAAVPMLQYAIPFAGGFAATLTYHRLASENEATAAMAGGIAHRSILMPAAILGGVLMIVVVALSQQVIPHFLRNMERVVRSDLTGILLRTIERRDSIQLGGLQIYADEMIPAGPDPDSGAIDRFQLRGVLAIQAADSGDVDVYISAESVNVWLFEDDSSEGPITTVQLEFRNATGDWPGNTIEHESLVTERIPLRGALAEDPKYLTFGELHALRAHPENMRPIESRRRVLALRMAQRQTLRDLRTRLRAGGRVALDRPGGERVVVHASNVKRDGDRWVFVAPPGESVIRIERNQPGLTSFVQRAPEVWIEFEEETAAQRREIPTATLILHATSASATDARTGDAAGVSGDVSIAALTLVVARDAPEAVPGVSALLREAQSVLDAGEADFRGPISRAAKRLRERNASLQREVTSKQHERLAFGFASLLTVFTGAVAALRRRYSLPLPVYLWSFVPALGAIITIGAGQGLAHESGLPGLALLWGGLIALAAFTWGEYTKLCRH